MENFVKGFLGVFIFAMVTYLCTGVISAEIETSQARNYMDNAKRVISESNLSEEVLQEVGEKAVVNGYEMNLILYERGQAKKTFHYGADSTDSIGDTQNIECVEMTMTYDYSMPIIGVKNQHTVRGYVN